MPPSLLLRERSRRQVCWRRSWLSPIMTLIWIMKAVLSIIYIYIYTIIIVILLYITMPDPTAWLMMCVCGHGRQWSTGVILWRKCAQWHQQWRRQWQFYGSPWCIWRISCEGASLWLSLFLCPCVSSPDDDDATSISELHHGHVLVGIQTYRRVIAAQWRQGRR